MYTSFDPLAQRYPSQRLHRRVHLALVKVQQHIQNCCSWNRFEYRITDPRPDVHMKLFGEKSTAGWETERRRPFSALLDPTPPIRAKDSAALRHVSRLVCPSACAGRRPFCFTRGASLCYTVF